MLEEVRRTSRSRWQFIRFMRVSSCLDGGGQPKSEFPADEAVRRKRMEALYAEDKGAPRRMSHENAEVQTLYRAFYGAHSASGRNLRALGLSHLYIYFQ